MRIFIVVFLIFIAFSAQALRQNGVVSGVVAYEMSGKRILFFKLDPSTADGCNTTGRFTVDDQSKMNFELMSSTILSAFHSKTPVQVEYPGTCNAFGNAYDARFICLGNINC